MLIFIGLEARISTPLHQGSLQRRNPWIITRDLYTFYNPIWFGSILRTRTTHTLLQAPKASILALVATLIPQFISVRVGIDLGLIDSKANPGKSIVSIPLNGTLYKYIAIKGFTDYTVYHVWLLFFAQCTRYFFNATHHVKEITIAMSKANPLSELVNCFSPLRSTYILTQFSAL